MDLEEKRTRNNSHHRENESRREPLPASRIHLCPLRMRLKRAPLKMRPKNEPENVPQEYVRYGRILSAAVAPSQRAF